MTQHCTGVTWISWTRGRAREAAYEAWSCMPLTSSSDQARSPLGTKDRGYCQEDCGPGGGGRGLRVQAAWPHLCIHFMKIHPPVQFGYSLCIRYTSQIYQKMPPNSGQHSKETRDPQKVRRSQPAGLWGQGCERVQKLSVRLCHVHSSHRYSRNTCCGRSPALGPGDMTGKNPH